MFNISDTSRDAFQLHGAQAECGSDWWWHSFTGHSEQTGEERSFFIEFFTCNPALGEEEPVLGQKKENREAGKRPSYLMVKAGSWGEGAVQLHRFFGWKNIRVETGDAFEIEAEDCFLNETRTRGQIRIAPDDALAHPEWMCGSGEMSWDLAIDKKIAFNVGYGASAPMRKLQAFEMFWHAEGMKTQYSGRVTWNGESYLVDPDTCWGYADKNWGKDFTSPWIWLSSNNLTSTLTGKKLKNSVFDIGGGRPKIGPLAMEGKLLSAFWYEGEEYEFNFSEFWTMTKTSFHCEETSDEIIWHIEQSNLSDRMITDIRCPKKEMLLVNYESPDGEKRHNRLWNGGTGKGIIRLYRHGELVDVIHCANTGCEYGEYGE